MLLKSRSLKILPLVVVLTILIGGCGQQKDQTQTSGQLEIQEHAYPHIAGYDKSGRSLLDNREAKYDIVYSSEINAEAAKKLKDRNPGTILLYQSPANYLPDSAVPVVEATTGQKIDDDFWLKDKKGARCGFGWTPEGWTVDITKSKNIETMALFFANVLKYHPQYEGIFLDLVEEKSRCDSVSDDQWILQTNKFLKSVRDKIGEKIILTNSGWNYKKTTPYLEHLNGYGMESFLAGAAGFGEGLSTVDLVLEKNSRTAYFNIHSLC